MKSTKDSLFLVREIRKGNRKSFDELCEMYSPLIESICRKYSHMLEADEIRQICRIKLYDTVFSFRLEQDKVTFGSFASSCLTNAVISELRRLRPTDALPEEDDTADICASPEDTLIARERLDELMKLIQVELSPYEQEVFGMYLAGKSYAEMAHLTGKTEASVGTAITRAKTKLRKIGK